MTIRIGIGIDNYKTASGATPPSYTARTQAFLTATGITDVTIAGALDTMDSALIAAGLLPSGTGAGKLKAIYPMAGGTATTHKFNFVDPADTDAAFRLSFSGGWTHAATGAKPNGTNGYADTFLNIASTLSQDSTHISVYLGDNIAGTNAVDIGNSIGNTTFYFSSHYSFFSKLICNINNSTTKQVTNAVFDGYYIANRVSGASREVYKDGNNIDTFTVASSALINASVYLGRNDPSEYSPREQRLVTIGTGLTPTEVTDLNSLVTTFQTALGRNV